MTQPSINAQEEMDNILLAPKGDIMSMGYGLCPQMLFRDYRISHQAKAIYGYFASFAGAGAAAFPSKTLMSSELGMSDDTLSKYLRELTAYGYIKVTKKRNAKGRYVCNVYELCREPVIEGSVWERYAEKKAKEIARGAEKYARKKDREKEAVALAVKEAMLESGRKKTEPEDLSNELGIVENDDEISRDVENLRTDEPHPYPENPGMEGVQLKNPCSRPYPENPGMEKPGPENPGTKSNSDGNSNNSKQTRQENRGGSKEGGGRPRSPEAPENASGQAESTKTQVEERSSPRADSRASGASSASDHHADPARCDRWNDSEREAFELLCAQSIKPVKEADSPEAARLWGELRQSHSPDEIHEAYRAYRQRYFAKNREVRYAMKLVDWMRKPKGFAQDAAAVESERQRRLLAAKRRAGEDGLRAALYGTDERYREMVDAAEQASLEGDHAERARMIDRADLYYMAHRDDAAKAWVDAADRKER